VWYDTNRLTGEHEYDQYQDADVEDAARFRDGLVSDSDFYKKIQEDYGYNHWTREYKKHSEIVYRHLEGASDDMDPLCGTDAHTFHGNNGLCSESIDRINMMQFHIKSVEGYQSQKVMRSKVFTLLYEDIEKLHKSWSKGWTKSTQLKYFHALAVILHTIVNQKYWIKNKVYSSHDLNCVFDATARVQNVISVLMRDGIFTDEKIKYIQEINEMNNRLVHMFEREGIKKTRFFTSIFLTKLSSMEKSLIVKYGDWTVGSSDGEEGEGEGKGKVERVGEI
jgi:hypothetical protein